MDNHESTLSALAHKIVDAMTATRADDRSPGADLFPLVHKKILEMDPDFDDRLVEPGWENMQ